MLLKGGILMRAILLGRRSLHRRGLLDLLRLVLKLMGMLILVVLLEMGSLMVANLIGRVAKMGVKGMMV